MSLVLDASATLPWCFRDAEDEGSRALFARVRPEGAAVPALWFYEVANAVLVGAKRKRLLPEDAVRFLDALRLLPLSVDAGLLEGRILTVFDVAHQQNVSVYDAAYLELARNRKAALATRDEHVRRVARRLGIRLFDG